jgi:septum formation protein
VTVEQAHPRRLVLASASPRRQQLLRDAGYDFIVEPANVNEENFPPNIYPIELAMLLAHEKADAVAPRFVNDVILAADTVVAFGDRIINKPKDAADAWKIIELLAGTTHIVITGLSVVCLDSNFSHHTRVMSGVRMKPLASKQIDAYIARGLWQGKAGGYGIQDPDPIVQCIGGEETNVVGLPMKKTKELLTAAGVQAAK